MQAPAAAAAPATPDMLNILVGTITDVKQHPEAEKLFLEQIDVGEEAPRQVISGDRSSSLPLVFCNRIGRWKGKPPKAQCSTELKTSTSFEWHDSTITKIFPSTPSCILATPEREASLLYYCTLMVCTVL